MEVEEPSSPLIPEASKFDSMLKYIEKELKVLEKENDQQLGTCHTNLQKAFSEPVDDSECYRAEDMENYPQEFLAQISKLQANDLDQNYEWYLENTNEIILNTIYPSKLEKEFLKHIELQQQKKNDLTYKKLLSEIDRNKKGNKLTSDVFEQEQMRLSTQRQI